MPKVLIADDSPTDVEVFRRILAARGYEIITAIDGIEAERTTIEEVPDILILDILMPKKNGFQVCRDLRRNPRTKDIPIVIVTSKGADADVFWGKKQGADEYLIKPFSPQVLLDTVARLLGGA